MKYPEHIMAILTSVINNSGKLVQGLNHHNDLHLAFSADYELRRGVVWAMRDHLDESANFNEGYKGDRNFRQVLPYVVIRRADGKVLPYLRGKGTPGESRLHGKGSIGWGGHIDFDDNSSHKSILNPVRSVYTNIERELNEELFVFHLNAPSNRLNSFDFGELEFRGFLIDNTDDVGRLHLGLFFVFTLHEDYEAVAGEEGLRTLPWMDPKDFANQEGVTWENWSRILFEQGLN